jgi:hypothetical protein
LTVGGVGGSSLTPAVGVLLEALAIPQASRDCALAFWALGLVDARRAPCHTECDPWGFPVNTGSFCVVSSIASDMRRRGLLAASDASKVGRRNFEGRSGKSSFLWAARDGQMGCAYYVLYLAQ